MKKHQVLFACALVLALSGLVWPRQAVFDKVEVRFNKNEKDRRLVDKDADLIIDDAARKLIVKNDQKPLDVGFGDAQMTVALVGDPAPGTGGGAFSGFREPDVELNNPGDVAFWSEITGAFATSGHFLGSATAAPAARLIEGQGLPGGGAAGFVSPGINNFIGEQFSLTDAGEMSIFLINITGAPNLGRYVIASATGALREFATTGDKAQGTGSSFGGLFQSVATNSTGRFFFMALLVDGPAKSGVFWDK